MALIPHFCYHTFGSQIFWLILTFTVFYFFIKNFFLFECKKSLDVRDSYIKTLHNIIYSSVHEIKELETSYESQINLKMKEVNNVLNADIDNLKKQSANLYCELMEELYHYIHSVDNDLNDDFLKNKSNYDYVHYLLSNFSLSILNNDEKL